MQKDNPKPTDEIADRIEQTVPFDEIETNAPTNATDGLSGSERTRFESALEYVRRISDLSEFLEDAPTGPEIVGRFSIVRQIGEGGFASVYLAMDPQLDRPVAIKVPHLRHLLSDPARARFAREAKAAGTLSHPNIVPIFEVGNDYVAPYIVSEYCEGETLLDWIQRNDAPVDPRLAARIVSILADAMQYSHSRGIVHRDLKPANLVIAGPDNSPAESTDFQPESVRILDFGLAKLTETDESITIDGDIVGTPAYMAPEVARGEDATALSDVYSLGVILYRLVTNELPHRGDSHLAILKSIQTDSPVSPRTRLASVPHDIDAIIMKCMRKQAEGRYRNAHELQVDLNSWLGGRPVQARPLGRLERLKMWYARETRYANALLLAASILLAAIGTTTWLWRDSKASLDAAEESIAIAKSASRYSAEKVDDLTSLALDTLDNYSELDHIVRQDPDSNPALRKKMAEMVVSAKKGDGIGRERSMDSDNQEMIAVWSARLVAVQQWKIGEYHDAINTVRSSISFKKDDRVCQAISGGSCSYFYGILKRDREKLNAAGLLDDEIESLQEELRSESLRLLETASDSGYLWLDQYFWNSLSEDEEFKRIIAHSKYPIFINSDSPSKAVSTLRGVVGKRMRQTIQGLFNDDESKEDDPPEP